MKDSQTTQELLELRKVTRSVAELLRNDLAQYLGTLMPLVRPRTILGHYVQGAPKEVARGADKIFKDLQAVYDTIASARPFNLPHDLKAPLPLESNTLEFEPFEYTHTVKSRGTTKAVAITSPLKWIVYYAGYPPQKLQDALRSGDTSGVPIDEHVLNHVTLHVALFQQRGVAAIFEALRFPASTHHLPDLGNLPITVVSAAIPTIRPSDERIIESTELSGSDAFEEVVDVGAIRDLADPLRQRLSALLDAANV
jgi:hypothetical protein